MTRPVRTRFAPSPTGFQHIGGMRTAFYAWLLAKHHGGQFLLRIEDTDQQRLVPGAVKFLLEELQWFGVSPDEGPSPAELEKIGEAWPGMPSLGGSKGPYVQSQRLARYREVADQLIAQGVAYRCDCTPEMLERERLEQMARREVPGYSGYCRDRNVSSGVSHVVRFRMPSKRTVVLEDAIRGRIQWDSIPLRDTVLLKSDGFPTYHLAVVVDDHDMEISHVMRGEEWLSTAPLHLLLYEALSWEPPVFSHLPVVMGPDGKKLSKRHGATTSSAFREEGYLAEALLNYVVLVGWAPGEGDNTEIFTREGLIEKFSLRGVNEASAVFDYNKLQWMNGMYIRALSLDAFIERAMEFVTRAELSIDPQVFRKIAPHVQERVKILSEVPAMIEFLCRDLADRDWPSMFKKGMDRTKAKEVLEKAIPRLEGLAEFSTQATEEVLRGLSEELGLKAGPMFTVIRIGATGKSITPPLFESLECLGKEVTVKRLRETLTQIDHVS